MEKTNQAKRTTQAPERLSQVDSNQPAAQENFFQKIRVLKRYGFRGVTNPVMITIPGASAATAANYTTPFFIAHREYIVVEVRERHETAGSDVGAVTVMLKKVPSGTAPASGTDLLTAGISLKATANTNQNSIGTGSTITLVTSNSTRRLVKGDALSLVTTGTLTAVAGVTVQVILQAI